MNDVFSSSQPSPNDENAPVANSNSNVMLDVETIAATEGPIAATSVEGEPQVLAGEEIESNRELTSETMKAQHAQWEAMWADGENAVTRWGRAAFIGLAGWFLAWSQLQTIINTGTEWNRWVWLSVVCNFLLPAGIVWLFFAQGLRAQPWLSDARLNAWNYGWNWRNFARHLKIALVLFGLMLPVLWFTSRDAGTREFYHAYFPAVNSLQQWLWLLGTLTIYMACWEWFFRGFLLFGIAQATGPIAAILLQAILFGMMHAGKPMGEMISSFAGGAILGAIAWREKSFVPAFLTHALVHVAWAILVLN